MEYVVETHSRVGAETRGWGQRTRPSFGWERPISPPPPPPSDRRGGFPLPAMFLSGQMLVLSPLLALMLDQLRKLPAFVQDGLFASSQHHRCLFGVGYQDHRQLPPLSPPAIRFAT
uniref:Uncharacterized protein n=1 Tax=Oryza nivara TaxID=4536 RepID=A0A0E0IA66_ORYNI